MEVLFISLVFYSVAIVVSVVNIKKQRLSFLFIALGVLFYFLQVALLGARLGALPFADKYSFYSLLGTFALLVFMVLSLKSEQFSKFVAFYAFLGVLSDLFLFPAEPSPYKSPLYNLHILFALLSYLGMFFAGLSSLLKMLVESKLKHKTLSGFFLPLEFLRLSEKVLVNFCLVFLTLTLIFGSLWTRSYIGKHWISDPKLLFTLILWLYYAFVAHLSLLKRIKPKSFSYMVVVGAFLGLLNLLVVRHGF
ncbi:MAG: cytochrome C biogenesis protein [Aquificota bacterium]|nr:MAG: cytochrome C biogenesis protein [Aquificota bacterium]